MAPVPHFFAGMQAVPAAVHGPVMAGFAPSTASFAPVAPLSFVRPQMVAGPGAQVMPQVVPMATAAAIQPMAIAGGERRSISLF